MAPDIPAKFDTAVPNADYVKREVMIPMRDGVKLHTVIVIPKGAARAPMVLSRTPYNASGRAQRNVSPSVLATVGQGDEVMMENGYIRVFQDVRGKYGSEGDYVMTRPVKGPLNDTRTDHTTDAWDTIEWLVKHVPESNGKVGMIGSSYEGFTVLMALVDPHPALKVAVPMSPMVDGWRGDDWFHNGAFRLPNLAYIAGQTAAKGSGKTMATGVYDDYEGVLRGGSTADYAKQFGLDQLKLHPQAVRASGLRQLLAAPGAGQDPGQAPDEGADHDRGGLLGPGRHLRRPCLLLGRRAAGHGQQQELPGGGAVAPQRRQLRRLQPGRVQVHRRHRAGIPPRRHATLPRPVPEGWRAGGRHAAGAVLPDRRQPLAAFAALAAGLRAGLPGAAETGLPEARLQARFRRAEGRRRLRRIRVRPGQARAFRAAPGAYERRQCVAAMAGQRPARRLRPHRCASATSASP